MSAIICGWLVKIYIATIGSTQGIVIFLIPFLAGLLFISYLLSNVNINTIINNISLIVETGIYVHDLLNFNYIQILSRKSIK